MAEINPEYERGFKDGLKSKIGEELQPMIAQVLEGISEAIKGLIPRMIDIMEIKAKLDVNDWIPCSERLPKSVGNKVIVFCTGEDVNDYVGFGHYEKYEGVGVWLNLETGKQFAEWGLTVQKWMPLPEPPEKE